jgi:demethylmenaquinone methyltransferase / 2-methoxy-6-polyprenyl-1,4-benzoquinol methylase
MSDSLPHDHIVPFKNSNVSKKEQVAGMFDKIAGRYDFMNRFLSAGTDKGWRRKALRELTALQPQYLLDVATGTADVAIMAHKMLKPAKIVGIDISEGMLEIGRKKLKNMGLDDVITLQKGDSETINFPDNTFDAVTVAFGVRNFERLHKGISELYRVLQPGGKVVILEFSRPKKTWFKRVYNLYMKIIAPGAGRWLAGNKDAYAYLNDSVQAFPERENFVDILDTTGFRDTGFKTLSFGICCIYSGTKPSSSA